MPRRRDETAHAATRERILRAAEDLFAQHGFHATGMAAICDAVGMSPGALYRYFPSKAAIVVAFVEEELSASLAMLRELEAAPDLFDGLVAVIEASIVASRDDHYVALATEVAAEASRNPEVAVRYCAMQERLAAHLADILRRGQADGDVDPAVFAPAASAALLALVDGSISPASSISMLDPSVRRAFIERLVRSTLQMSHS